MSNRKLLIATLTVLLGTVLVSAPVLADHERRGHKRGGSRIGVGYAGPVGSGWIGFDGLALSVDDDFDSQSELASPRGFRIRTGMDFRRGPGLGALRGPALGMELHAGYGRDSDVRSFDSYDAWVLGGFLRGSVPIGPGIRVNGLVGLATVGIEQEVNNARFSDSAGDLAYGFGIDVRLAPRTNLSAGWTRYAAGDEAFVNVSGWSLGLRVGFY